LSITAILRKNPVTLKQIFDRIGYCDCYFCESKEYIEIIKSSNSKLHFLETIHSEINEIKAIPNNNRLSYFIKRIDEAISNYKLLGNVFKPADYSHLTNWKQVFEELNK